MENDLPFMDFGQAFAQDEAGHGVNVKTAGGVAKGGGKIFKAAFVDKTIFVQIFEDVTD